MPLNRLLRFCEAFWLISAQMPLYRRLDGVCCYLGSMILRHWRGWTELLPDLKGIQGYRGGYVRRSDGPVKQNSFSPKAHLISQPARC